MDSDSCGQAEQTKVQNLPSRDGWPMATTRCVVECLKKDPILLQVSRMEHDMYSTESRFRACCTFFDGKTLMDGKSLPPIEA